MQYRPVCGEILARPFRHPLIFKVIHGFAMEPLKDVNSGVVFLTYFICIGIAFMIRHIVDYFVHVVNIFFM